MKTCEKCVLVHDIRCEETDEGRKEINDLTGEVSKTVGTTIEECENPPKFDLFKTDQFDPHPEFTKAIIVQTNRPKK